MLPLTRLAKQVVFDILHLVPEILQLLCQGHFGLGKHLPLFVLDMLFHREAQGVEFRRKGRRIGLKPPEFFDAHLDLFMGLQAGVTNACPVWLVASAKAG